jgi:hypothetical protein
MSKKTAKVKRKKQDKKWEKTNGKELDKILPGPSRNSIYSSSGKSGGHHTAVYIGRFSD